MYRCAIGTFNILLNTFRSKDPNKNFSFSFHTLRKMFLFIFSIWNFINDSFSKILQSKNNKTNHMVHGNISGGGTYKLLTWNKGNSNFSNRRDDVLISLNRHNPDIFSIHEANYSIKNDVKIKGYKIEYNNLIDGNDICRTIILIRDSISYKRRYDLENKYISSI